MEDNIKNLTDTKKKYETKLSYIKSSKKVLIWSLILILISIVVILIIFNKKIKALGSSTYYFYAVLIILIFYSIILIITCSNKYNNLITQIENDINRIDEEIELLVISTKSIEQRAEKLFKLHQNELSRYYNENIRQMKGVYNLGLGSIIIGFILILGTIIFSMYKIESINNYIIPIMGVISGILSSFIGTLFIKMYTETVNASSKFHDKLVDSNNLHFSNFLVSKISNDEKREEALSIIAKAIAEKKES